MTILIYEFHELEERESKHLRVWKVFHTTLYILAAIFGILNYTFLFETEHLVQNRCIFYPQKLDFHWVELPNATHETTRTDNDPIKNEDAYKNVNISNSELSDSKNNTIKSNVTSGEDSEKSKKDDDAKDNKAQSTSVTGKNDNKNETIESHLKNEAESEKSKKDDDPKYVNNQTTSLPVTEATKINKREAPEDKITTEVKSSIEESNGTMITANKTHRYMLNPARTLFPKETDTGCQLGEYMPLLSTVFASVWATLFLMCPNGGRSRGSELQKPWRIMLPALIFAFVMVIMTGISFTSTNGGLQAFCAAFQNYTNTTTCSAVNPFLERSWNRTSWHVGHRVMATRAAAAGVWASWACACALLLARCLTAADFLVKHTEVKLVNDPAQKVAPHLKRQMAAQRSGRSAQSSPSKRDAASVRSEPTAVTELVSASVEHEPESDPTSLMSTPVKDKLGEELEMIHVDKTRERS